MGIENQLRDLAQGFEIISAIPELKNKPIIIGESDPEGCAACPSRVYPQNAYRNGLMYPSYMAAAMPRHLDLAAKYGVNLMGAVTWAFEFEDQPYFDGFRDLATNGIDKPVLGVFRMLGMMTGNRLEVENPGAVELNAIVERGVKVQPDIHAMASADIGSIAVLVSHYQDSSNPGPAAAINLTIRDVPAGRWLLHHYRVDENFSNAYEVWKKMGSPQKPTAEQYAELERAGQLQLLESPQWIEAESGSINIPFTLPRHGVSLIRLVR
jgi:xylan 1,4-beta-xylosidase